MVFEVFFLKIHLKNHFVGSLQPFCSGVGLGASTFWLPQPNPPNSKWDCFALFYIVLWNVRQLGAASAGRGLLPVVWLYVAIQEWNDKVPQPQG